MTKEQWDINHSYEIAVRNMNPAGWAKMTENEKIQNLQAIENKNAMDNGRLPAEVRVEDMPDNQLGYQRDNSIVINRSSLNCTDYLEVLNTEYHEGSHVKDWQASFLSEVRESYTSDELVARNSPIPNPNQDWDGYWNHPAEVAARDAGKAGVEKTMDDQIQIMDIDREYHFQGSQIFETYDYLALDESGTLTQGAQTEIELGTNNENEFVEVMVEADNGIGADLDEW